MKKIFTMLALMLTWVGGAFAGVFENSVLINSGGNKIVVLDQYQNGATIFLTTTDIATAARNAKGLTGNGNDSANRLYYRRTQTSGGPQATTTTITTYVPSPTGPQANSNHLPSNGNWYISNVIDNAKYIALYNAVKSSEQELPNIELADHGQIGSKFSAAANAAAAIKNAVGQVNNNSPYTKLQEAINTAKEVLEYTELTDKDYDEAATALTTAVANSQALFADLEGLRDSLIIVNAEYEDATSGRALKAYPAAQDIFESSFNSALNDYQTSGDDALVKSDINLLTSTLENLKKNAANYSPEALEFYDKITDPNYNPESVTETLIGYPPIASIAATEYAAYVTIPTKQMADAGIAFGKEVAAWSGSAPLISYSGIALATATFAANMAFAGELMAANIKHIMTLQECIDFLNKECKDDYAYNFLKLEMERSKVTLRSAQKAVLSELQDGVLKSALATAKELNALRDSKDKLDKAIYDAEDIYDNEMNYKRADGKTQVEARKNLKTYIREAEHQKEIQYEVKKVTYEYTDPEVSLYNWEIVFGNVNYSSNQYEAPHSIIDRETTKLRNAIEYCQKQYGLENTIDDAIEYRDSVGLFKSPKDTVATIINKAEIFNLEVTARKYKVAQIDSAVNAILGTLELARNRQQIISDSLAYIQQVVDESVNNIPTDSLKDALLQTTTELMNNESDWDDVKDLLDELYQGSVKEQIADEPQNYSAYMIARVEKWLQENDRYKDLTPAQLSVIYKALSAAKTALAEFYDPRYQTYDELKRTYLLKRMYYSSLALEYVEKMTVASPVTPDLATQQLAEALAVYACYAASQYDETIDEEAVKEGNRIFKEGNAAQKTQAAARLYALLNQYNAATGINAANGKGQILNGKVVENGRVVIIKNGKKYTTTGVAL